MHTGDAREDCTDAVYLLCKGQRKLLFLHFTSRLVQWELCQLLLWRAGLVVLIPRHARLGHAPIPQNNWSNNLADGARKKPTPSKRKANTQGTQQDGAHDDSERDNHGPRKRQRRPTSASMRYDEAIKLSMAALESPEPEPEHPINVIVSDIVGAQRGNAATRPASELENTSNSQRPSGFRARRGKSSSGMRSSLGSSSRHEAHGMDRMNVHSDDGFDHHRRNTIDVVGSSRVDPGRSIQNSHSKAARQNSHTQASILSQNGIMGPGIPHSEVSSGKLPSVAIIDTLSKSQQRQIYGILSGIEGGMAHLQKQFKTLQNLLGIDTDDE